MSTGFLSDPKVERLIDRHGPNAVAVAVALMAQTMRQEKAGAVELTYRTLGYESHTDKQFAFDVVSTAAETGFLVLAGGDDYEFEASFPAWEKHQGNYRQQKSRASRKPAPKANVTDGHAGVTRVSPTGQDIQEKTGQDKQDKKASGKPSEFDSWLTHYRQTTGKQTVRGSKPARTAFAARLKDGYTLTDLQAATVGCHADDFCRNNGHDVPETILRAGKVERYIALASKAPAKVRADYDAKTEVFAV